MDTHRITYPYFLGIGGIGMSALACHYLHQGCKVAGYDRVRTPLTRKLEAMGAEIHYTESPGLLPEAVDAVVYTPAIPSSHAEWGEIRRRGLPVYKRAQVLGMLSRRYKTLAVAGTHGKTTTSALLAYLMHGSIGCNAVLGGIVPDLDGNYLHNGRSPYLVTEADEYDRSFLQLNPWFSAVTAWDADHLDIYGDVETMREAYVQFMRQSEHFIAEASLELPLKADYVYGMAARNDSGGAAFAENVRVSDGCYTFDYSGPKGRIENLRLSCPGRHNIENAVAAVSLALEAGVEAHDIRRLLPLFKGVRRRLEPIFVQPGLAYYDDYAHHPAEITASIDALREFYPDYRMAVFFQPHLYTRTRDLAQGFAQSLRAANELCLVDIYPARELPIPGVDTRLIGDKVEGVQVRYAAKENVLAQVEEYLREQAAGKHRLLLVTMGAGDIDTLVEPIRNRLQKGGAA
ncbi:MAG: UDP-N-acetylmuramate--L-alanine ligase [Bacteroides sp.]|nr:UDP-N-acetylmuramate--L-alanine ligase [Ruminococcus flavefaciens]MCM1554144.1 UDP-N-acetylmuramate--L-alanine ligase [Bacteroides sp.]